MHTLFINEVRHSDAKMVLHASYSVVKSFRHAKVADMCQHMPKLDMCQCD